MTQTPLQELLKKVSEGNKSVYGRSQIVEMIQSLLPKEREFVGKVWDAGAKSTQDCTHPQGPCDFESGRHTYERGHFINQLYPEK